MLAYNFIVFVFFRAVRTIICFIVVIVANNAHPVSSKAMGTSEMLLPLNSSLSPFPSETAQILIFHSRHIPVFLALQSLKIATFLASWRCVSPNRHSKHARLPLLLRIRQSVYGKSQGRAILLP